MLVPALSQGEKRLVLMEARCFPRRESGCRLALRVDERNFLGRLVVADWCFSSNGTCNGSEKR
ncbi:hypothetical protein XYCOK13_18050 [Xylanibacillus composti]|uniref:Uncharacterized protein n=1 Tax=Xylanibacillus composti TaxID=1572762 RepID=A0A8J4H3Q1_9BACL|nr:hypothetical protein XYCOK13_18050 [Xylanibacillus composti]